ncbi:hypothetical protein [Streptomyces sp. NPDC013455]|uniref:hypothetical protein n=1 Tax=Streptomyces sp. NPDC013455 TaxID=3155605 RepID=UPI0034115C11
MPESAGPVTELASQYVSQVTHDLEHNLKEQERVTAEIAALQEQLATLQHDHAILLNMQQALGVSAPGAGTVVPSPRKKSGDARRKAAKKPAARQATSRPAQPTLVELVRGYLAEQSEPRSAAEVTEALGRAHPGRGIQTKVVRTTLENLVARNGARRTKQGPSVFYTVRDEPTRTPADTPAADTPAAEAGTAG